MIRWLLPTENIDPDTLRRGLRAWRGDGLCSQVRDALVTGPFLVAFALGLGASNTVIGLLSAVGPLTQLVQLPAVAIITRLRARKVVAFWTALPGRLTWVFIAFIPWLAPASSRVGLLVSALLLSSALGTIAGAAWNPWMRDFIPESEAARLFAHRLSAGTAASAATSLIAGAAVDDWLPRVLPPLAPYSAVFLTGTVVGVIGLLFLARIPEPRMPSAEARPLGDILRAPFQSRNFRQLILFLGTWNFAVNLASPFVTVYLLRRLEVSMAWAVGLSVVSQVANAYFLRLWGPLADRFGHTTVLRVSGALFVVNLACWPFAGLFAARTVTLAIIIGLHLLGGAASAGITLCAGTVALKFAPRGESTAFLATNALVSGAAAAIAPVLAGISADWFETQRISVAISWTSTLGAGARVQLLPMDLHGLDFLFVLAATGGLYALHRLLAVQEGGAAERRAVVSALALELGRHIRYPMRMVTTLIGVRDLVDFPYTVLGQVAPERRKATRAHSPPG